MFIFFLFFHFLFLSPSPQILSFIIFYCFSSFRQKADCNWEIDFDHLESLIDENTSAILITNPSNPCGSVFSAEHLKAIADVALKHKLPIIADEIYAHMGFTGMIRDGIYIYIYICVCMCVR